MSNGYSVRKLSGRFDPAAGWSPSTPPGARAGRPFRFVHGRGIGRICESVRILSADLSAQRLQHHAFIGAGGASSSAQRHGYGTQAGACAARARRAHGHKGSGIVDLESDTQIDAGRVEVLRRASAELLGIDTAGDVEPWCGLRPMTPDSRPIIGWSPLDGLFINSGHGMLGWTLAFGSARLTADMIDRKRSVAPGRLPCAAPRNKR
jgi:glycine/D-amino acid oxidase-like deaminating enzyme